MKKIVNAILIVLVVMAYCCPALTTYAATDTADVYLNLSELTYGESSSSEEQIKVYSKNDYDTYVSDFNNGNLPSIYITEFVYDGLGKAQKVSLDDDTNEVSIKDISTTVININTTGNIEITGTATDTMLAINTNDVTSDINLILNGVNLTSSKNTSAIIVYNKDITWNKAKVTIKTKENTKNYVTGGKLKKVSTMLSSNLDSYTGVSSTYSDISSSYYYYFENERKVTDLSGLLFAVCTADSEKVQEGSPYTYYKYSGAISSDVDLYFEGAGYLEVASVGDEGIESKGDIVFSGGTGDYKITSYDDGLNASTSGTDISINVNSMYVEVLDSGDDDAEGDGIDSNGTIHIEGGTIYAFAHPTSQDDGIDSSNGTYINGGTVIATGNMGDEINSDSSQEFIKINFKEQQAADTLIVLTNSENNPVMAFKSARTFTTLTYSSGDLKQATYYLYKNGEIEGTESNGLYTNITSYSNGIQQQYSNNMGGNMPSGNNQTPPDNNGQAPASSDGQTPPEIPSDNNGQTTTDNNGQFPTDGAGQTQPNGVSNDGENPPEMPNDNNNNNVNSSYEFTLTSSNHTFNNVTDYDATSSQNSNSTENKSDEGDSVDDTTANTIIPQTGEIALISLLGIVFVAVSITLFVKYRKMKKATKSV